MSQPQQFIMIGCDYVYFYEQAKLSVGGTFVNAGTGTWILKDSAGASLGNGSMTYVTSSNGNWYLTVPSTITAALVDGTVYYLEITFNNGAGADDFRRIPVTAVYHESLGP